MSTKKSQRIGIWIIAVVMIVGTIGSFFVIVIANENNVNDQKDYQSQLEQYKAAQEEAKKQNQPLDGYKAAKFDANKVEELKAEVLKEGKGEKLKADSSISANYFGWTSDGVIFDSTKKIGKKVEPIDFSLNGVIPGWTKGLTGQKVGSVVRLTIPADMAYGSVDDGSGRPVGPLMFVVEIKELKK